MGARRRGELRHHLGREQPQRLHRLAGVDVAEIDLQRGLLERTDRGGHAADGRHDLRGRADPGAAGFDLAVEGEGAQAPRRGVVVAIVLRGRAPFPVAHRLVECAEILLERRAGYLAGALGVLVTEHVEGDHHLAVAGMAGIAPGLAVARDQRGDGTDGDRHQRVALLAGELERFRRLRRCDVELGARCLRRTRQRGHAVEGMEGAAVARILLREQEVDLLKAFAKTRLRFIGRDAEAPKLVRQEGAREAYVEPAARQPVEHGDLAGELERMVEHRQHRAGHHPHPLRALRHGAQEHDRIGAVAAVSGEIVLDRAPMMKAELVGLLGDRERFRVVGLGALVGMVDCRKKLHTELHLAPCSRSARGGLLFVLRPLLR